jgi:hypothetical protein
MGGVWWVVHGNGCFLVMGFGFDASLTKQEQNKIKIKRKKKKKRGIEKRNQPKACQGLG